MERKLTKQINEVYRVLKANPKVRSGLYQATYKKKAVATGAYQDNKKVGLWHYYDENGDLMQNYDYSHNHLLYERPDDLESMAFTYAFDKGLDSADRVTKPVRLGGRFFGYQTYFNLYNKPKDISQLEDQAFSLTIMLLVSPGGRLADYTYELSTPYYGGYDQKFTVNLDAIPEDEKMFVAATLNGEPVASTIFIKCTLEHGRPVVISKKTKVTTN